VAFAFEDLTEKLDSPAEEFRAAATLIEPTAQALPKLTPFLSDSDERVRCVTLEALEQARDSRHAALARAAKGILAGWEPCPLLCRDYFTGCQSSILFPSES